MVPNMNEICADIFEKSVRTHQNHNKIGHNDQILAQNQIVFNWHHQAPMPNMNEIHPDISEKRVGSHKNHDQICHNYPVLTQRQIDQAPIVPQRKVRGRTKIIIKWVIITQFWHRTKLYLTCIKYPWYLSWYQIQMKSVQIFLRKV